MDEEEVGINNAESDPRSNLYDDDSFVRSRV